MTLLSLLRATALLFAVQLSTTLRSRRTLICVLVALVPVGVAAFVSVASSRNGQPAPETPTVIGWYVQVQVIVPILALVLGSGVVAGELEDRTLTYLFTRPIPRASVLLGRWLAALLVLSVLLSTTSFLTLWFLDLGIPMGPGIPVPEGVPLSLFLVVLLGAAVYSAVFAAAGTFLKHPMIVGLGYVFAIEGFLANLPGDSQGLTLQYYLRSFAVAYGPEAWRQMEAFEGLQFDPGPEALRTLGLTLAVALGVGFRVVSRRQYVLPA